jgi:hypothetical protein
LNFANRGVWVGGEQTWTSSLASIEAVLIETEAKETIAAVLSSARSYLSGAENETKGYVISNLLAIWTNATKAMANGGNMLTVGGGNIALQSTVKAYASGGGSGDAITIDAVPFSTNTVATIGASLNIARRHGVGIASSTKGYFGGGIRLSPQWLFHSSFEALTFSNESIANIGATLDYATDDIEGIEVDDTKGVIGGGIDRNKRSLQQFSFVTEARSQLAVILNRGGRYPVPVGNT